MFNFKKIKVPTGDEKELTAYESWSVRWNSRHGPYSGDLTKRAEVFRTHEEAEAFKKALEDANKLLKNTANETCIELEKN